MLRIVGFCQAERRRTAFQMEETAVTKEERQESTELLFWGGQVRNNLDEFCCVY